MKMANGFFHFGNGAHIGNATITKWLNDAKEHILEGHSHSDHSSGDSAVTVTVNDDWVKFFVMQNSGYASLSVRLEDLPGTVLTWERLKSE